VNAIVKPEGQSLQLPEKFQAQVITDLLADIFAEIARQHGHQATDQGCSDNQAGTDPEGLAGGVRRSPGIEQQVMGLIHRAPEQARQSQTRQG
jgi:hypothetical protein